jgi:hypothetical protein
MVCEGLAAVGTERVIVWGELGWIRGGDPLSVTGVIGSERPPGYASGGTGKRWSMISNSSLPDCQCFPTPPIHGVSTLDCTQVVLVRDRPTTSTSTLLDE